ncbi:hypothetical protein [Methanosarcina mazei]|uniref:Uncharacterized protein n=1 Tax=Methanosarcina mazei TaxID=2209 RepID=A0A0F8LFV5_METMZ|nr:hypothetical protein [Methanosarcina mazei]KKH24822.1 hypothetical protein DU60_19240 [Methanosarcina mazei]
MLPEIASYIFKTATTIYLDKIKMKEEQPNVSFAYINGSYKIELYEGHENVLLKLKILVTIQVALTRLHIFPRSEQKLDIK